MKLETLEQYYLEELRDLYDAEKQLTKALPRMAKAASHQQLKSALQQHAAQTERQAGRLEKILKKHGVNGKGRKCKAMTGLIEEGKEMMSQRPSPDILDVCLITTAQKVEHYEIAGYGCTATYARLLNLEADAKLLHQTLEEEKATDNKLTRLAETIVNSEAKETDSGPAMRATAAKSRARTGGRTAQKSTRRTTGKKSGGRSRTQPGQKDSPGEAHSTKDLEEIKAWAEPRGGQPARVCGTGNDQDPGILRLDFPGYSGEDSLEHISWDEWFEKFQENNLTFLYQDKTKDGKESRFFKLVCMETPPSS